MRVLLFAVPFVALFTLTAVDRAAEARGDKGSTYSAGKVKSAKLKSHRTAAKVSRTKVAGFVASAKVPGGCGTYMYWKDGKCNDARDKK